MGKNFEVCTSGMSGIWEVKGLQETLSIYPMTSSTPTLMTELHKLNILVSSSKKSANYCNLRSLRVIR